MNATEKFFDDIVATVVEASTCREPNRCDELLGIITAQYARLGVLVADAQEARDQTKAAHKHLRSQLTLDYVEVGNPVGRSEHMAEVETKNEMDASIKAARSFALVRGYRENLEKTMDALRTRISLAKTEVVGNGSVV